MNVLVICGEYPLGGGGFGSYVKSLAPALTQRGHEVHVLSCLPGQDHADELEDGVWVHRRGQVRVRTGLGRLLGGPVTRDRLVASVSTWVAARKLGVRFDVLEIADWGAEGLILGLVGSTPTVAQLHTPLCIISQHNGVSRQRDVYFADKLERLAVRRARVVTSPSELLVSALQRTGWLGRRQVRVMRNPVDLRRWADIPPPDATAPTVLAVGRVEHLKGSEVLVDAAALLARAVENLSVVFIGRSSGEREGRSYRESLMDRARTLAAPCRFVEQVPRSELGAWYRAARVVAVPSLWDNLPMGGLEAMAAGRPVVCTWGTGLAEIVDNSGAGAVVPAGDAQALANALLPFVTDPSVASVGGARSRAVVVEHCVPERIAEQRERCYLEACGRQSSTQAQ
jgi:glycogen(starch) synthase